MHPRRRRAAPARARSTTLYGSLMAAGGARRPAAAAAGRAAVRDLTRGLRRPPAARAAVDGRQLVLVGAPVDEHAAAAEPRPVRDRLGGVDVGGFFGDATGELLARWTEFGDLPAVLPQPLGDGHARAGAVGVRRAVGDASAATCCWLRMRLLPYLYTAVRGGAIAPARRSCGRCCSSIRRTRRRTRPTTSSCSARAAGGADRPARDRAPARLPARGHVGALVDRRACRGPAHVLAHAPLGSRRSTRGEHADPAVARAAAHGRGSRLPYLAGVRGSWGGLRVAV